MLQPPVSDCPHSTSDRGQQVGPQVAQNARIFSWPVFFISLFCSSTLGRLKCTAADQRASPVRPRPPPNTSKSPGGDVRCGNLRGYSRATTAANSKHPRYCGFLSSSHTATANQSTSANSVLCGHKQYMWSMIPHACSCQYAGTE